MAGNHPWCCYESWKSSMMLQRPQEIISNFIMTERYYPWCGCNSKKVSWDLQKGFKFRLLASLNKQVLLFWSSQSRPGNFNFWTWYCPWILFRSDAGHPKNSTVHLQPLECHYGAIVLFRICKWLMCNQSPVLCKFWCFWHFASSEDCIVTKHVSFK